MSTDQNERISVSLSTLRAELSQLELRIVDRLNSALDHKADRAVQDQLAMSMADVVGRLGALENTTVKRDGPVVQKLEAHELEITNLQAIGGYRKWLLAQTVALVAIAVPVVIFAIEKATS